MGYRGFCRSLLYLLLWISIVNLATMTVAVAVPSLAVLWFTSGQYHSLIDQYVVYMVDAYDLIVAVTLLLMLTCMMADFASWLLAGRTLSGRVLLRLFFTNQKDSAFASEDVCRSCGRVILPDHAETIWSGEALTQATFEHLASQQLDESQSGSTTSTRIRLKDGSATHPIEANLKVRELKTRRSLESTNLSYTSHGSSETLLNAVDRNDAEAEQAAIATEIHRLLQGNVPDTDPYFDAADKEEFQQWVVDADDVEILGDLVTEWLRKRDDLQAEKDRYLMLFHMRGLDSTSQLYRNAADARRLGQLVTAGQHREQEDDTTESSDAK